MPKRVQLKRTKGWKKPPECVVVARPTVFGNPWSLKDATASGLFTPEGAAEICVNEFRAWLTRDQSLPICRESEILVRLKSRRDELLKHLPELKGRDLACWCPEGSPCHADVLLEMANRE
ncbi:hypothetical protein VT84_13915 [Gemmata sp. SH-PL17]|uniref:DUF4326 domain-containing protein n=1 Tax=Gemmata sp. SH-PL17 TaxID=1630693 RepID=UPI00078DEDE9|nr:DUF4326 domain-containing protein [Gemmata sp. SH-PL17]AMV25490.1 hypothetical protein VT84_13915 [Gemmata sp. SH-PL17]